MFENIPYKPSATGAGQHVYGESLIPKGRNYSVCRHGHDSMYFHTVELETHTLARLLAAISGEKKVSGKLLHIYLLLSYLYGTLGNAWRTILPVCSPLPYSMPVNGSPIICRQIVVDSDA